MHEQTLTPDQYMAHYMNNNIAATIEKPKHQERFRRCVEALPNSAARIVDVGCALGDGMSLMHELKEGFWVGVDFCLESLTQASMRHQDFAFEYVPSVADLSCLEAFNFDAAVCTEVLEHVPNDIELIRCVMALAPVAIFTTPNRPIVEPGHIRVYSREGLEVAFKGFSHTVESHGDFWYILCERPGDES